MKTPSEYTIVCGDRKRMEPDLLAALGTAEFMANMENKPASVDLWNRDVWVFHRDVQPISTD